MVMPWARAASRTVCPAGASTVRPSMVTFGIRLALRGRNASPGGEGQPGSV
jgi:hypothetical protein